MIIPHIHESSSKDRCPLLKWEYHSNVFDRLRGALQKLLAAFRTFQHQFSPDRNRNQCTHAAALSPPSWNATNTVVDIHPRASTEQMQGDTDLWFCTSTCTELPRVPPCCHFATYYNFPEKKSVPELNDQPTYMSNKHRLLFPFPPYYDYLNSETCLNWDHCHVILNTLPEEATGPLCCTMMTLPLCSYVLSISSTLPSCIISWSPHSWCYTSRKYPKLGNYNNYPSTRYSRHVLAWLLSYMSDSIC